jgi:hypothetical protein
MDSSQPPKDYLSGLKGGLGFNNTKIFLSLPDTFPDLNFPDTPDTPDTPDSEKTIIKEKTIDNLYDKIEEKLKPDPVLSNKSPVVKFVCAYYMYKKNKANTKGTGEGRNSLLDKFERKMNILLKNREKCTDSQGYKKVMKTLYDLLPNKEKNIVNTEEEENDCMKPIGLDDEGVTLTQILEKVVESVTPTTTSNAPVHIPAPPTSSTPATTSNESKQYPPGLFSKMYEDTEQYMELMKDSGHCEGNICEFTLIQKNGFNVKVKKTKKVGDVIDSEIEIKKENISQDEINKILSLSSSSFGARRFIREYMKRGNSRERAYKKLSKAMSLFSKKI